jgi:hypothetical protein
MGKNGGLRWYGFLMTVVLTGVVLIVILQVKSFIVGGWGLSLGERHLQYFDS